jgi:hypothetical protein
MTQRSGTESLVVFRKHMYQRSIAIYSVRISNLFSDLGGLLHYCAYCLVVFHVALVILEVLFAIIVDLENVVSLDFLCSERKSHTRRGRSMRDGTTEHQKKMTRIIHR